MEGLEGKNRLKWKILEGTPMIGNHHLPDVFLQVVPGDLGPRPDGVVQLQIGQPAAQLSTASQDSDVMCQQLRWLRARGPWRLGCLGKGLSDCPIFPGLGDFVGTSVV